MYVSLFICISHNVVYDIDVMYIYICLCACVCVCVFAYVPACACVWMWTCVCAWVHIILYYVGEWVGVSKYMVFALFSTILLDNIATVVYQQWHSQLIIVIYIPAQCHDCTYCFQSLLMVMLIEYYHVLYYIRVHIEQLMISGLENSCYLPLSLLSLEQSKL